MKKSYNSRAKINKEANKKTPIQFKMGRRSKQNFSQRKHNTWLRVTKTTLSSNHTPIKKGDAQCY